MISNVYFWCLFHIYCDIGAEYTSEPVSVVLRKGPNGFGMTMSGSDPVFIQYVQEGKLQQTVHVCQFLIFLFSL